MRSRLRIESPRKVDQIETAKRKSVHLSPEADSRLPAAADTGRVTPGNVLSLQHSVGNQAVMRQINAKARRAAQYAQRSASPTTLQSEPTSDTQRARLSARSTISSVAQPKFARRPASSKTAGRVQRHSSFEHKMLGDLTPDDLKILASSQNLDGQGNAADSKTGAPITVANAQGQQVQITKENVLHTLMQEIDRIKYFRDSPPGRGETKGAYDQRLQEMDESRRVNDALAQTKNNLPARRGAVTNAMQARWDVRLVEIPSTKDPSQPLIVTYGEMNTLADLYGSPEELKDADPKNRWEIVQGVRQQSLFAFMDLYNQVKGGGDKDNFNDDVNFLGYRKGFDGAAGDTGRAAVGGGALGQLRLMAGKDNTNGAKSNSYSAGLGRNACHFAPESWYSFAHYHALARQLAKQAHDLRAKGVLNPAEQKQAESLENEALLQNGFGDHFLQDSFAAGHLINKTEIMKLFVKWLDRHPDSERYVYGEDWQRIQAMAYGQPGIGMDAARYNKANVGQTDANDASQTQGLNPGKDPQSVENMGGSWQGRFDALGLSIPQSVTPGTRDFAFVLWWQQRATGWFGSSDLTVKEAIKKSGWPANDVLRVIRQMIADGVASIPNSDEDNPANALVDQSNIRRVSNQQLANYTIVLRDDYVPKNKKKFAKLVKDYNTGDANAKSTAAAQYTDMSKAVTYKSYHEFLNNTTLQTGTNVLHDYFCKQGLDVLASGVSLGHVYGDGHMLDKDSAKGVEWSGKTAEMSRNAIFNLIQTGNTTIALEQITARFPDKVMMPGAGRAYGLAEWQSAGLPQGLEQLLNNTLFEESKITAKTIAGGILKGSELSSQISKDATKAVHEGQAF